MMLAIVSGGKAQNRIRRDSSEMNSGWSLGSTNQITTKGQQTVGGSFTGKLWPEIPGEEQRESESTDKKWLIGFEMMPGCPKGAGF